MAPFPRVRRIHAFAIVAVQTEFQAAYPAWAAAARVGLIARTAYQEAP